MLILKSLGPFAASVDGRPLTRFGTVRGQALLIFLAIEKGREHRREALMDLLWPGMPLKSAQNNLRQTLYLLRNAAQDAGAVEPPVLAGRWTVQLNPNLLLEVDVHSFLDALRMKSPANRQAAADLYRGPFLADFFLPDSEPFETWAAEKRAAYARLALDNLDQLTAHCLAEADFAAAEAAARRALALDDLHEPAHRQLIETLAATGNHQAAVTHYESFRQQLAEELDVEPAEATRSLVERIRHGDPLPAAATTGPASQNRAMAALHSPIRHGVGENLPAQTKPFFGREAELQQLDTFFAAGDSRLVTILGPGGMGKTHLAIEWARRQLPDGGDSQMRYPDGVYFVDLAPLESQDQIAPAMAEVFAVPLQGGGGSPDEQVLDFLRAKKLLVVLDNFEHLRGASSFVKEILLAAAGVHILVTSRERLNLSLEQGYAIEGLAYPADPAPGWLRSVADLALYPAVQLFLRSARRRTPAYELSGDDQEAVARICNYTAGMPLAVELAAAWIDLLPLGTVADELEGHLDILETEMRDLPKRHRSIRAAIDTTWKHLETVDKEIFSQLSIFRGGFTWEAVTAILGPHRTMVELRRSLLQLRDKSLLSFDPSSERFAVHELLRQFGAEKLRTAGQSSIENESVSAQERHAAYYTGLLQSSAAGLTGAQYAESLRLIDRDLENILASWDWLIDHERRAEIAPAMDNLGLFHDNRGYLATGERNFKSLAERWRDRLSDPELGLENIKQDLRLLARALAWQAAFVRDTHEAESLLKNSLALLDDPLLDSAEVKAERAFVTYRLGYRLRNSQIGRAIAHLEQSLALYQELDDLWGVSYCLQNLGFTSFFVSLVTTRHYLLQASEVFEKTGDVHGLGWTLNWLCTAAGLQGDIAAMESAFNRYLTLVDGLAQSMFHVATRHIHALVHETRGEYGEAVAYRETLVQYYKELGRRYALSEQDYLAINYLNNGQFEQGRVLLMRTLQEFKARGDENDDRMAFCLHVMAMQALAEDEFERAFQLLEEAMVIYEINNNRIDMAGAYSLSGMALIGLGDLEPAPGYFANGLELALEHGGHIPMVETILSVSLLRARQERLRAARKLYELAWRQPRFRVSVLYDGIYGQKIRSLTQDMNPDELYEIAGQAAVLDIWQEAALLLQELQDAGREQAIR